MRRVISVYTSASALVNRVNVAVAGKTGTAQESENRPDHALFISYAPYENPEVSVTCVIQNGYSSGNATELAGFVYAYLYDKDLLNNAEMSGNNVVSD
jgi:penicillin-binding protein 2